MEASAKMDTLLVIGRLKALDSHMTEQLQAEGLDVFQTDDADEGLRFCLDEKPTLVFVEVDAHHQDNFDLLPRLRAALDSDGRIIAVCNRYAERLDDYCEALGANFALPQTHERAHFNLFVRGLISLIPTPRFRTQQALRAVG